MSLIQTLYQYQGTKTFVGRASDYLDELSRKVTGDLNDEDFIRVLWLSSTLFFVVGGYWLLRSLKDPIMSVIDGVSDTNYDYSYKNLNHIIPLQCNYNFDRLNIFHKQRLPLFLLYSG